jgi:hypothetical protein
MENIQSNIQGENMETQSTIQQLFQEFINGGGEPKVTSFKRHLDQLINSDIKPLCGRSTKTGIVDDWRSELKARFGGRGAKWVKVSIDNIEQTLAGYDSSADAYRLWIYKAGYAWIRFAGPRVANGVKSAAFEVRTGGSTIDHPKQLHYIPVSELDMTIENLNSTPHAMKLEETTSPVVKEEEAIEIEVKSDDVVVVEEDYEDMMGDIEALMAQEEMDI